MGLSKLGIYPKTQKNRPGMGKTVGTGPPVRTQQQRVATNGTVALVKRVPS